MSYFVTKYSRVSGLTKVLDKFETHEEAKKNLAELFLQDFTANIGKVSKYDYDELNKNLEKNKDFMMDFSRYYMLSYEVKEGCINCLASDNFELTVIYRWEVVDSDMLMELIKGNSFGTDKE